MLDRLFKSATSRRRFLQGAAMGLANKLVPGAGLVKEMADAVGRFDPLHFTDYFVEAVFDGVFRVAQPFLDLYGRIDDTSFKIVCGGGLELLNLDPKERAVVLQNAQGRLLIRRLSELKAAFPSGEDVPTLEEMLDNTKILDVLFARFKAFEKAIGKRLMIENAGECAVEMMTSWPALAKNPAAGTPPAWWQDLDERGKFEVWFEALNLERHHLPSRACFGDDDPRLMDIVRDNLSIDEKTGRRGRPSYQDCVENYGPNQGPREFKRGAVFAYQAEGLGVEEAARRVEQDLKQQEMPSLFCVRRVQRLLPTPGQLTYEAGLVTRGADEENFARMWSALSYIDHSLEEACEEQHRGRNFSLTWKGHRLRITVPDRGRMREIMETFCTRCFEWDTHWFSEHGYGIEPPYDRQHARKFARGEPGGESSATHPRVEVYRYGANPYDNSEMPAVRFFWAKNGFHL